MFGFDCANRGDIGDCDLLDTLSPHKAVGWDRYMTVCDKYGWVAEYIVWIMISADVIENPPYHWRGLGHICNNRGKTWLSFPFEGWFHSVLSAMLFPTPQQHLQKDQYKYGTTAMHLFCCFGGESQRNRTPISRGIQQHTEQPCSKIAGFHESDSSPAGAGHFPWSWIFIQLILFNEVNQPCGDWRFCSHCHAQLQRIQVYGWRDWLTTTEPWTRGAFTCIKGGRWNFQEKKTQRISTFCVQCENMRSDLETNCCMLRPEQDFLFLHESPEFAWILHKPQSLCGVVWEKQKGTRIFCFVGFSAHWRIVGPRSRN